MQADRRAAEANIVVSHAVRWVRNILVEVLGNHAKYLDQAKQKCLRAAVDALTDYDTAEYQDVLRNRRKT
jgi:hypothetical protein